MEFDWTSSGFEPTDVSRKEIEESFEDPFSIRLMPDIEDLSKREARYFILGRAISGRSLFTVFWTDGKRYRVIFSRLTTPEEGAFYERKNSEFNL